MKYLKTLRIRFALWTAGFLFAALGLFGLFVYANMSHSLATPIDETLHLTAMQLLGEIEVIRGELVVVENPIEESEYAGLREQGLSMRLLDLNEQPVKEYGPYRDLPLPLAEFSATAQPGEYTTALDPGSQQSLRVYSLPVVKNGHVVGILQVAQSLANLKQTLSLLLITLLLGGLLVMILAGGGGYFLAARALAPIDQIIRTARHISANDLSTRLNLPATEDEVGRLAATFDSMLARLDDAFRRERQFSADASHELRTPLSAMQTIIDSTLGRQRTPAEYEQALLDLGRETGQMRILTDGLLHLARYDAAYQRTKFESVDLSTVLKDVADSLRPLADGKGLALIASVPNDGLELMGDSDALIRLFVNLLDNAIKYTEQGYITLFAKMLSDTVLAVTISDSGVGIAPEHLPYIFDRFYRVDESRSTKGTGLGLAIASDIARAHGGGITVESEVNKGTTFVVQLSTCS